MGNTVAKEVAEDMALAIAEGMTSSSTDPSVADARLSDLDRKSVV